MTTSETESILLCLPSCGSWSAHRHLTEQGIEVWPPRQYEDARERDEPFRVRGQCFMYYLTDLRGEYSPPSLDELVGDRKIYFPLRCPVRAYLTRRLVKKTKDVRHWLSLWRLIDELPLDRVEPIDVAELPYREHSKTKKYSGALRAYKRGDVDHLRRFAGKHLPALRAAIESARPLFDRVRSEPFEI